MTYEQTLEARKDGKFVLTTRNFKFIKCGTEQEIDDKYKRGNKIFPPLVKKIITKEKIKELL